MRRRKRWQGVPISVNYFSVAHYSSVLYHHHQQPSTATRKTANTTTATDTITADSKHNPANYCCHLVLQVRVPSLDVTCQEVVELGGVPAGERWKTPPGLIHHARNKCNARTWFDQLKCWDLLSPSFYVLLKNTVVSLEQKLKLRQASTKWSISLVERSPFDDIAGVIFELGLSLTTAKQAAKRGPLVRG